MTTPLTRGRPACRSRRFGVGVGAELPVPFQPVPAERYSAALAGPQQLDLGHGADDVALHGQLVVQLGPRLNRLRAEAPAQYRGDTGVGGPLLMLGDLRQEPLLGAGERDRRY